jgi:hypothetical protein
MKSNKLNRDRIMEINKLVPVSQTRTRIRVTRLRLELLESHEPDHVYGQKCSVESFSLKYKPTFF